MPFIIIMTTLVISYFNCNCWDLDFCLEGIKEAPVLLVMRPWVKNGPHAFSSQIAFCFLCIPCCFMENLLPLMNKRGESFSAFFVTSDKT